MSYVSLPPSETAGAEPNQVRDGHKTPTPRAEGLLVGFSWNGVSEDYYSLDAVTGERMMLGTVGDLELWNVSSPLTVDQRGDRLYVVGLNEVSGVQLYTLDSKQGTLLSSLALDAAGEQLTNLVVSRSGELLGFVPSPVGGQDLIVLDRTSGSMSVLSTLVDVQSWSGEVAYDAATDTLHLVGNGLTGWTLYQLDATEGSVLHTAPLTLAGADFSPLGLSVVAGELLGFTWDGAQELLLSIDPESGVAVERGVVGDLAFWSTVAVPDLVGKISVFGSNAVGQAKLYTLDTETGALDSASELSELPSQALLVY